MELIFKNGKRFKTAGETPVKERGAFLLVCITGDMEAILCAAKNSVPVRIEAENGETALELPDFGKVSQVNNVLETGETVLLLRRLTDGEKLEEAAAASLKKGVDSLE